MSTLHWEPPRSPSSTWHMGYKKGSDPTGTSACHAYIGATRSEVAVRAWQEAFRSLGGGRGDSTSTLFW